METTHIAKWFFVISLAVFIIAWSNKDKWPGQNEIVENVLREPVQTEAQISAFNVNVKGKQYSINPKFNYEIWGMVVSCHESRDLFDYYHEQWGDDLNVKDVCVVWGENVKSGIFRRMKFSSGSWTCYPSCPSKDWSQVMAEFRNDQLSNNHLLVESVPLFNQLRKVRRGDQIYLKGYLVEYSHSNGKFTRGTSISRTDTGNGACETIFVTDFKMLRQANWFWRSIYSLFRILVILSLIFWVVSHLKSEIDSRPVLDKSL